MRYIRTHIIIDIIIIIIIIFKKLVIPVTNCVLQHTLSYTPVWRRPINNGITQLYDW